MRLVGTLLKGTSVFAVYAPEPLTMLQVWEGHLELFDDMLFFDATVRLVQVGEHAPPAVLPPDFSESLAPDPPSSPAA
jgi:hypothetical protein